MKLKEVIELLEKIPDKEAEVTLCNTSFSEAAVEYVVNYTDNSEPQSTVEIWV